MGLLILVRHGESKWNQANIFTGWVDVPLSELGVKQALKAGEILKNVKIDIGFTSFLERARATLDIILSKQKSVGVYVHDSKLEKSLSKHLINKNEIPVFSSLKINERNYGKLQGMNKDVARKKWGEEQVQIWRRSWDVSPPEGESLKDTCQRAIPYFTKKIMPYVKRSNNVIVSAHGNSLRGIIKYIEKIGDDEIPNLELPMSYPMTYNYVGGKFLKMWKNNPPNSWTG